MSLSATILIVEDELIIANSIAESLGKAGYLVAGIASSAQEALQAVEATSPDLVLMDIRIKGAVDGIETAAQIRSRFQIPVIFLTAYADPKTLERAKITEPFGYIVKPVSRDSLVTGIEIALYKHAMERKLAEHQAWLETILQSSAEAMIVTSIQGQVQFVNKAAERLTGLSQARLRGRLVDDVVTFTDGQIELSPQRLLERASSKSAAVTLPRHILLRTDENERSVGGQFAISRDHSGAAMGGIITLHDVTTERLEEQQIRQEQKMGLLGDFAQGVAGDLFRLLDVISSCTSDLSKLSTSSVSSDSDFQRGLLTILQSSNLGMTITRMLLGVANNSNNRPEVINMATIVRESLTALQSLCGSDVQLATDATTDLGTVYGDRNQMEQLLLNLVLNAKERLSGPGKIRLLLDNVGRKRGFVRIRVQAQSIRELDADWTALTFPFQMDCPPFSLTLAGAIVTAAEGYLCSRTISETANEVEVLLQRVDASYTLGSSPFPITPKAALLVGLSTESSTPLHAALTGRGFTVFEAATTKEALLVLNAYARRVDAIVVDGEAATVRQRKALKSRVSTATDLPLLMALSFCVGERQDGWKPVLKPAAVSDLVDAIEIAALYTETKSQAAKVS